MHESCEQRLILAENSDLGEMRGQFQHRRWTEKGRFGLSCAHLPFVKQTQALGDYQVLVVVKSCLIKYDTAADKHEVVPNAQRPIR